MAARRRQVIVPVTDILSHPANGATIDRRDSQILFGEIFEVEKDHGEWAEGRSLTDGYAGFVRQSALATASEGHATHLVERTTAHIYPAPDFKTRPLALLPCAARLAIANSHQKAGFVELKSGGWIFESHIRLLGSQSAPDPVDIAMQFLGAPYLYGGRTALGIDCSGLVQTALLCSGYETCPRDSDQQIVMGALADLSAIERGDLVFFSGHVGIMLDSAHILNATARTMDVRIERLSALIDHYGAALGVRRL